MSKREEDKAKVRKFPSNPNPNHLLRIASSSFVSQAQAILLQSNTTQISKCQATQLNQSQAVEASQSPPPKQQRR